MYGDSPDAIPPKSGMQTTNRHAKRRPITDFTTPLLLRKTKRRNDCLCPHPLSPESEFTARRNVWRIGAERVHECRHREAKTNRAYPERGRKHHAGDWQAADATENRHTVGHHTRRFDQRTPLEGHAPVSDGGDVVIVLPES
jgi:hypothetical protein